MPIHVWIFLSLTACEIVISPVRIWYFKYTFDKAWDTLFDRVSGYALCCVLFYVLA